MRGESRGRRRVLTGSCGSQGSSRACSEGGRASAGVATGACDVPGGPEPEGRSRVPARLGTCLWSSPGNGSAVGAGGGGQLSGGHHSFGFQLTVQPGFVPPHVCAVRSRDEPRWCFLWCRLVQSHWTVRPRQSGRFLRLVRAAGVPELRCGAQVPLGRRKEEHRSRRSRHTPAVVPTEHVCVGARACALCRVPAALTARVCRRRAVQRRRGHVCQCDGRNTGHACAALPGDVSQAGG